VRPNKIKQMWRAGQCVTMGWLSISHGFTAEVMARQGFDTLCIDMQHGTTEMKDVWPMLQAISQTDTVPVVRVPWNDPATIMKALDLGAYGIIVPLVNTAAEAAKAVAACRYPPVGMRSSGPVRAVHYGGADYVANANDEIVIMAMIETTEGLANLDAICATPGLDAVYIGPACRSRWAWTRAATIRTRCTSPPATRSANRRTSTALRRSCTVRARRLRPEQ
jgi:4-hydroxy-2-oxoheptanedioate aldolase